MLLKIPFPSLNLQLHAFPNPRFNNRFMIIFNIKLLYLPLVHHPLLSQEINGIALLQNRIALILLILQHTLQCSHLPFRTSITVNNAFLLKYPFYIIHRFPTQKFKVQPFYNRRLLPVNHQLPILIRIITQKPFGTHLMLPLFKPPADPPGGIFRYRPALILCQRRQNGQQNFTFRIQCIDVFLFRVYSNQMIFYDNCPNSAKPQYIVVFNLYNHNII